MNTQTKLILYLSIVSVKEINTFMLQVQAATGNVSTEVETALNATINVDENTPAASKYITDSDVHTLIFTIIAIN